MSNADSGVVCVRYMIDDVDAAVAFYTVFFSHAKAQTYAPIGAENQPTNGT